MLFLFYVCTQFHSLVTRAKTSNKRKTDPACLTNTQGGSTNLCTRLLCSSWSLFGTSWACSFCINTEVLTRLSNSAWDNSHPIFYHLTKLPSPRMRYINFPRHLVWSRHLGNAQIQGRELSQTWQTVVATGLPMDGPDSGSANYSA